MALISINDCVGATRRSMELILCEVAAHLEVYEQPECEPHLHQRWPDTAFASLHDEDLGTHFRRLLERAPHATVVLLVCFGPPLSYRGEGTFYTQRFLDAVLRARGATSGSLSHLDFRFIYLAKALANSKEGDGSQEVTRHDFVTRGFTPLESRRRVWQNSPLVCGDPGLGVESTARVASFREPNLGLLGPSS